MNAEEMKTRTKEIVNNTVDKYIESVYGDIDLEKVSSDLASKIKAEVTIYETGLLDGISAGITLAMEEYKKFFDIK